MSKKMYAWYSKEMAKKNTCYIYKDINGNDITTTCVSDSSEYPFQNVNTSVYKDFVCLGEVFKWIRTDKKNIDKKI